MITTADLPAAVRCAARAADDTKAIDTLIIDVGEVFAVSDYFVITSGANPRQVRAIVDSVAQGVRAALGLSPARIEGQEQREWVLLDYGAFFVHVFHQDQREFYQLERLWGDRPRLSWEPSAQAEPRPAAAAGGSDKTSGHGVAIETVGVADGRSY